MQVMKQELALIKRSILPSRPKKKKLQSISQTMHPRVTQLPASLGYSNVNNGNNKTLSLTHRELVAPIVQASSAGTTYVYRVNAANANIFPWLSSLAPSFEKYTINSMHLEYVPQCGTTTAGVVYLAFDYDPTDTNKTINP